MNTSGKDTLVISYLTLRKAIGILGLGFPFVLFFGNLVVFRTSLLDSISAYYYSGMRDVFVGILFAIGIFLFSYKGYEKKDDIAGGLACIFAIGIALFPTHKDISNPGVIGTIHFVFAVLFFLTLIYFSLFLFTKTNPDRPATRRKKQRNAVYRVCGYVMASCIVLMAVYFLGPDTIADSLSPYRPIFWLESIAIIAFGISWLVKGEAILGDEGGGGNA